MDNLNISSRLFGGRVSVFIKSGRRKWKCTRLINAPRSGAVPVTLIGQLHDVVILLQLPESFSLLFSCAIKAIVNKPQWN